MTDGVQSLRSGSATAPFSVCDAGLLVYQSGTSVTPVAVHVGGPPRTSISIPSRRQASDPRNSFLTTNATISTSWSADGRFILYVTATTTPRTRADIWALPLFGERKPFPLVQTSFDESEAQFSPDGQWVVCQSHESGQAEIYVVPFPTATRKWPVSTAGGRWPRWTKNEIFSSVPTMFSCPPT